MAFRQQPTPAAAALERLTSNKAVRILPLDALNIDPSYQRDVTKRHKQIIANFDPNAVGTLLVGQRADGTLWVVDGLQRLTALKALGHPKVRVDAFVSNGPEHEAQVFKLVNANRTPLRPMDLFKARLTAGDEAAWEIKKVVEAVGFRLSTTRNPSGGRWSQDWKYIRGIAALQRIARINGYDGLKLTLEIVRDAWPEDVLAVNADIIGGISLFLTANKGVVDTDRLLPRLRASTPSKILYSCRLGAGSRWGNVAQILESLYRKRAPRGAAVKGDPPAA